MEITKITQIIICVSFLWLVISQGGIVVDPSKIEVVLEWESPKFVSEIGSFLGLARYY